MAAAKKRTKNKNDTSAPQLIKESQDLLLEIMRTGLKILSQDIIKQLMYKFKTLPPSRRISAINTVEVKGTKAYRDALWEHFLEYAGYATKDAAKESKIDLSKIKFAEEELNRIQLSEAYSRTEFKGARRPPSLTLKSYQFAKKPPLKFTSLPKKTRDRIDYESLLLLNTQVKDLEKALFFAYAQSAPNSDSAKIMEFELNGQADDFIGGPSVFAASGNSAARVISDARQAFFFEPDVLDKIESFTSVNSDPVAEICIELAGVTVLPDDPALVEYATPRHHNCKSIWVANLKGDDTNPDAEGVPSLSKAAQDSIDF